MIEILFLKVFFVNLKCFEGVLSVKVTLVLLRKTLELVFEVQISSLQNKVLQICCSGLSRIYVRIVSSPTTYARN